MPVSDHRTLAIDRESLVEWYLRNRERSRRLFDLIDAEVYYTRPIALRNPIVFYEGHLPAFSVIAFLKRGLGRPGVDERLEQLFARGIDPDSVDAAVPRSGASTRWPDAQGGAGVRARGRRGGRSRRCATRRSSRTVRRCSTAKRSTPRSSTRRCTRRRCSTCGIACRTTHKHKPVDLAYELGGAPRRAAPCAIPAGAATLGADRGARRFGWDNEFGEHARRRPGLRHRRPQRDQRRLSSSSSRPAATGARELWSDADWAWLQSEQRRRTRPSGCSDDGAGCGTACSRTCRCRWRGRST